MKLARNPTGQGGHRGGTIIETKEGIFRAVLQHRGKRYWRNARTREAAELRLAQLIANVERGHTDGIRIKERRERGERMIFAVLRVADAEGWDHGKTAAAIMAQLSPRRIKLNITGPCVYCGTWVASTIDHVIPVSRGGTDDPSNLVSACRFCNGSKGNREAIVARIVPRVAEEAADDVAQAS